MTKLYEIKTAEICFQLGLYDGITTVETTPAKTVITIEDPDSLDVWTITAKQAKQVFTRKRVWGQHRVKTHVYRGLISHGYV